MDLSAIIVVLVGLLFFVGGSAWLELHSRRKKRADPQSEQSPQPAAATPSAGRTVYRRAAESE